MHSIQQSTTVFEILGRIALVLKNCERGSVTSQQLFQITTELKQFSLDPEKVIQQIIGRKSMILNLKYVMFKMLSYQQYEKFQESCSREKKSKELSSEIDEFQSTGKQMLKRIEKINQEAKHIGLEIALTEIEQDIPQNILRKIKHIPFRRLLKVIIKQNRNLKKSGLLYLATRIVILQQAILFFISQSFKIIKSIFKNFLEDSLVQKPLKSYSQTSKSSLSISIKKFLEEKEITQKQKCYPLSNQQPIIPSDFQFTKIMPPNRIRPLHEEQVQTHERVCCFKY